MEFGMNAISLSNHVVVSIWANRHLNPSVSCLPRINPQRLRNNSACECRCAFTESCSRRDIISLTSTSLFSFITLRNQDSATALALTEAAPTPVTLPKTFSGKCGYSFRYPSGFVEAINRAGDEGRQADGFQAVGLVGNFITFDTISVDRVPFGSIGEVASLAELAPRLVTGGNVRTQFLSAESREETPFSIRNEGIHYDLEYVTEVCRGNLEEGKGGTPDCVSPSNGSFLQTIVRKHIATAILHEGTFWVINASCSEKRWPQVHDDFIAVVKTFYVN